MFYSLFIERLLWHMWCVLTWGNDQINTEWQKNIDVYINCLFFLPLNAFYWWKHYNNVFLLFRKIIVCFCSLFFYCHLCSLVILFNVKLNIIIISSNKKVICLSSFIIICSTILWRKFEGEGYHVLCMC